MKDPTHPAHELFVPLPSDRKLRSIRAKTSRLGAWVGEWLERMPYMQPTPVRIPIGGPLLHVTPPLSPMFPVNLLINKGVYANKILKKKKKKKNIKKVR